MWVPFTAIGGALGAAGGLMLAAIAGSFAFVYIGYPLKLAEEAGLPVRALTTGAFGRLVLQVGAITGGGVAGLVVAGLQYPLIRRHLRSPDRWLWSATAAGALAGALAGPDLYSAATGGSRVVLLPHPALAGAVFGGMYGAVTGLALPRLVQDAAAEV